MKTTAVNKALRNSNLPEHKVVERFADGKIMKMQKGWETCKRPNYVSVICTGVDAMTLDWATQVVEVVSAAGLQAEIIYGKTFIQEVRITEASK